MYVVAALGSGLAVSTPVGPRQCVIRPGRTFFADWKHSSMAQRIPATRARSATVQVTGA